VFDYVQRHAKSEFGLELRVDKCEVHCVVAYADC